MPHKSIIVDGKHLNPQMLATAVKQKKLKVVISPKVLKQLDRVQKILLREAAKAPVYGVNTGFGPLANRLLPQHTLTQLQYNLIRSHASGAGDPVPAEFVKATMLVRLNTLVHGHSAVSSELVRHYANCISHNIIPIVYEHGAVGTSGDLVQLAHIALGLIGEGFVYGGEGKPIAAATAMRRAGITPYVLKPKEGLALINGTAMMTAVGSLVWVNAQNLLEIATKNAALALELVQAYGDSIDEHLHALRPHTGQVQIARQLRDLVRGSKLLRERRHIQASTQESTVQELPEAIQQVYSLRCSAQILGPLFDTLRYTESILACELNAVTDNPVYNKTKGTFLHGGNFHGDYIAVTLDQLKIPLVKMVLLSERRTNFFLNENINKSFPPFLNLVEPGLTLGLQGLQFVATSTAAHAQTLAYPHTVHSISTNGDNQDLVSMGTDAALIAHKVIENAYIVTAIEAITLAQAVDCAGVRNKLSRAGSEYYQFIRKHADTVREDRSLQPELAALIYAFAQR